jgi:hypothetical protein
MLIQVPFLLISGGVARPPTAQAALASVYAQKKA